MLILKTNNSDFKTPPFSLLQSSRSLLTVRSEQLRRNNFSASLLSAPFEFMTTYECFKMFGVGTRYSQRLMSYYFILKGDEVSDPIEIK